MKKESNGNVWASVLLIVLLFESVVLVAVIVTKPEPIVEEKAMLIATEIGTYENLYDSSEMFFNYRIDNFGGVEAKGVKVECKVQDRNGNTQKAVVDNLGSVASNSYTVGEVVTGNIPYSSYEDGTIFCYVKECDDCILLSKNIPELREFYEG